MGSREAARIGANKRVTIRRSDQGFEDNDLSSAKTLRLRLFPTHVFTLSPFVNWWNHNNNTMFAWDPGSRPLVQFSGAGPGGVTCQAILVISGAQLSNFSLG